MSNPSAPLDKDRHLRYWQRCFRTFLPHQYTGYDSSRMTLAFFIISAFDLLSPPGDIQQLTDANRSTIREWVLGLKHPAGGFCGSPSHALPTDLCQRVDSETRKSRGRNTGGANIAATSFALLILALVAENGPEGEGAFAGVDRDATLRWLRGLQRPDGSFGEVVLDDGQIAGGRDMRLCYLAATIRWCLRGDLEEDTPGWVEDIDVEALIGHIRRGQAYDGGIAESMQHESHAGYAYCASGALYLLDRPFQNVVAREHDSQALRKGIPDLESLIKFLASRQFTYLEHPDAGDDDNDPENDSFYIPQKLEELTLEENRLFVGFNGRCNKVADTCYGWWVSGSLAMFPQANKEAFVAAGPAREFILSKTQHLIGGFSKHPGGPPDIYHSYLGLAALATMGDSTLKSFDAPLCASSETVQKIVHARAGLIRATQVRTQGTEQQNHEFWKGRQAVWPQSRLDSDMNARLGAALEALEWMS